MGWLDKYQTGGPILKTPSSFIESARDQREHPEKYEQYRMGHKDPNWTPQPGTVEYIPIESFALPGTPVIKGIGKLGNLTVDAINPLSGIRKVDLYNRKSLSETYFKEGKIQPLKQTLDIFLC